MCAHLQTICWGSFEVQQTCGVFIFIVLFRVLSRLCNQSRGIFGVTIIYLRRTKIKGTFSSVGKRLAR